LQYKIRRQNNLADPTVLRNAQQFGSRTSVFFHSLLRPVGRRAVLFRDAPGMARVRANLFVNTWQGAIVVARAGEGLEHIGRVFRYLKEIVPLSC
jgi:hypothetical protein